jgi:hypothetical protein
MDRQRLGEDQDDQKIPNGPLSMHAWAMPRVFIVVHAS